MLPYAKKLSVRRGQQNQRYICFYHTENFCVDSYICVFLLTLYVNFCIFYYYPEVNQFQVAEAKMITLAKCYILARFSFAESIVFFFYHHSKISVMTERSLVCFLCVQACAVSKTDRISNPMVPGVGAGGWELGRKQTRNINSEHTR